MSLMNDYGWNVEFAQCFCLPRYVGMHLCTVYVPFSEPSPFVTRCNNINFRNYLGSDRALNDRMCAFYQHQPLLAPQFQSQDLPGVPKDLTCWLINFFNVFVARLGSSELRSTGNLC